MPLQGSLREVGLADLIRSNCQETKTVRIVLDHAGDEGEVFISEGQVVHAEHGPHRGVEAVFDMLSWTEGEFIVQQNALSPQITITLPWPDLLAEGMKHPTPDSAPSVSPRPEETSHIVNSLKNIAGVLGVVDTAPDGTVLGAEVPEGNGESEGALAVFIGSAADQLGEALDLGAFERGVGLIGTRRVMVVEYGEHYISLVLNEQASPAMVASAAGNALSS